MRRRRRLPGTGSTFRRKSDNRWAAEISVGGRADRKTVRRYAPKRENTKAKAVALLEQLQAEYSGPPTSTTPAGDYLAKWVEEARNIRPTTRSGYRAVVNTHLIPAIGKVPLGALTPADVEELLRLLADRVSPKSARNVHTVLRRALGQAQRAGLVVRNVASREFVDAPRVPVQEPEALTEDEVRAIVAASRGDRLEALVVTAIGTGLRQGELLGLAWEDLELDRTAVVDGATIPAPILRVRKELVYTPAPKPEPGRRRARGRYSREEPKTESSKRLIPLAPEVADALRAHRQRLIDAGFIPVAPGPVFVTADGGELSGSWVTHHFYAICQRAGIRRRPFKILRATFSSRLHDAGVSDVVIAALMGHARTHTTKRHYIATSSAAVTAAIGRLVG